MPRGNFSQLAHFLYSLRFYRTIGWARRLHDFASSRRKLCEDATCPPSPPSSRTRCTPDFEAQIGKPVCTRFWGPNRQTYRLLCRGMFDLPPSVMTPSRSFALSAQKQPTRTRHHLNLANAVLITPIYSCSFCAPRGPPMTPPGPLGSFSPSLLAFTHNRHW